MAIRQFRSRITTGVTGTPVTTTIVPTASAVREIVISVSTAGTAWTLTIQDKSSPVFVIVPTFTMAVPTDGKPTVIKFDDPIRMDGGVDAVTTGTTAGVVQVWITAEKGSDVPT